MLREDKVPINPVGAPGSAGDAPASGDRWFLDTGSSRYCSTPALVVPVLPISSPAILVQVVPVPPTPLLKPKWVYDGRRWTRVRPRDVTADPAYWQDVLRRDRPAGTRAWGECRGNRRGRDDGLAPRAPWSRDTSWEYASTSGDEPSSGDPYRENGPITRRVWREENYFQDHARDLRRHLQRVRCDVCIGSSAP